MVRSAATRSDKYEKKLRGSVWNQRYTDLKEIMVEQANFRFAEQFMMENQIKQYLQRIGMYGIMQHHYMNFGGRCWALSRTFDQVTLRMEAEQEASKWLRRGLEATHLMRIARFYGIDLSAWP